MGLMQRMPAPEDVFVAWLIRQPGNVDLVAAASAEVARLRPYASHPGAKRLHDLFCALISEKSAAMRQNGTPQLRQNLPPMELIC
ncbi:hypothetical protein MPNT_660002 [Candidatus Methylacidithermus pantelleriae]|uniref:Uncharacterized protein n=2 Tax=Candidatus Methylacidithermus pantelleriae TaxID=2744239 RepID=A0A8J2BLV6_9BACT|nr:hypothetical protein MPNT_660002 [Candidatus Methylacidithermus pantelleriae]